MILGKKKRRGDFFFVNISGRFIVMLEFINKGIVPFTPRLLFSLPVCHRRKKSV
jgi:hypothetical protein